MQLSMCSHPRRPVTVDNAPGISSAGSCLHLSDTFQEYTHICACRDHLTAQCACVSPVCLGRLLLQSPRREMDPKRVRHRL